MQRQQEEELLAQKIKDDEERIKEAHWVLDATTSNIGTLVVKTERRFVDPPILSGRRSFGGFNREIEKIGSGETSRTRTKETQNSELWSAVYRHREHVKGTVPQRTYQNPTTTNKNVYGRPRKRARVVDTEPKKEQTTPS
eukprot:TRINITY_DN92_c0_g1_i3.p1 TRINITY_DN92_c0_g1~~TRINITY_DN92_c0_g1_i3.p1  ORF type:complete len:140 (-),score=30.73 TRINITY_DN92_c0_g1_i3:125-544(-)